MAPVSIQRSWSSDCSSGCCQPLSEVSHIPLRRVSRLLPRPRRHVGRPEVLRPAAASQISTPTGSRKAGDFCYDLTGNVAHAFYGAHPDEVRVERSMRALPAKSDQIGSTHITRHCRSDAMTHRGYLGDHHFFTNEECWYPRPENAFRGDDLPYEAFRPTADTPSVTGKPTSFRGSSRARAAPRQHDHRCLG